MQGKNTSGDANGQTVYQTAVCFTANTGTREGQVMESFRIRLEARDPIHNHFRAYPPAIGRFLASLRSTPYRSSTGKLGKIPRPW
jgi:hypothetical protein